MRSIAFHSSPAHAHLTQSDHLFQYCAVDCSALNYLTRSEGIGSPYCIGQSQINHPIYFSIYHLWEIPGRGFLLFPLIWLSCCRYGLFGRDLVRVFQEAPHARRYLWRNRGGVIIHPHPPPPPYPALTIQILLPITSLNLINTSWILVTSWVRSAHTMIETESYETVSCWRPP